MFAAVSMAAASAYAFSLSCSCSSSTKSTFPKKADSPSPSSSRALESNADSTAGVSPTNSIEWQDQAYNQLTKVNKEYGEDFRRACQWAEKVQPCNAEECAQREKSINNLKKISTFGTMPKYLLAHYPKKEFCQKLSIIIKYLKEVRQARVSAREGSQPSLTSQLLNTTRHHQLGGENIHTSRHEDSRGRHVTGHQSQYQNVAHSCSETRQLTPAPKDGLTGIGAAQSSFNNVLQKSLKIGPPCTENNCHMRNTDDARNESHRSDDIHGSDLVEPAAVPDPIRATKKQKMLFAEFLERIEVLNKWLAETVVEVIDMTYDTDGTKRLLLQFTYTSTGHEGGPNLHPSLMLPDLVLHVVFQFGNPNLHWVKGDPPPWSGNDQAKALWDETFQKVLPKIAQQTTIGQIARDWDSSAREACREYAERLGKGSFSSKYGTQEKHK